jgi:Glycosyl transferase family 64 domain
MLTVVTLNWARPDGLVTNLHRYASYGIVGQVLCFNNGPALKMRKLPRKCVLVEASANLGLYARFALASLARTEVIFHTDDDICVPEPTLEALLTSWRQVPGSCHGLYGRVARPTYQMGNVFGPVEVVLTRALLCSRRVNNAALWSTPLFEDLVGVPHGNGEDIILSFAAMAMSRSLNFAYPLHAKDYPVAEGTAIHRMWPGHIKHRQQVVRRCRKIFSL